MGHNASAYGEGAHADFLNSAAFGGGATVTRANQVVVGTASNTYTLPGITSAASKAAQTGPTHVVTSDAFGDLALGNANGGGAGANFGGVPLDGIPGGPAVDLAGVNLRLDQLFQRISKAYTGTAMAFAMSASPTLLPGKKFALSANWGTFQGENGAALSGAIRIFHDMQLNGAFAYGFRENMSGGRAGLSMQW